MIVGHTTDGARNTTLNTMIDQTQTCNTTKLNGQTNTVMDFQIEENSQEALLGTVSYKQ